MKTTGVKILVREVLDSMRSPYSQHVIDEAFYEIQKSPTWLGRYEVLREELGRTVVNNWVGKFIAAALGKRGEVQVPSKLNKLTTSYSLLDLDAVRLPTHEEALEQVYSHYRGNLATLPKDIPKHRNEIVQLIMDGIPVEEAFAFVLQNLKAK